MGQFLDGALNYGKRALGAASDAAGTVTDKAKSVFSRGPAKPVGPTEPGAVSRFARGANKALGVADVISNAAQSADAFAEGDPYKMSGHFVTAGLNFLPGIQGTKVVARTKAAARTADLGADLSAEHGIGDLIGAGMHKADEFMARMGNDRAKQRLLMAGSPLDSPANTVARQASPRQTQVLGEGSVSSQQAQLAQPAQSAQLAYTGPTLDRGVYDLPANATQLYQRAMENGNINAGNVLPGTGIVASRGADGRLRGAVINAREPVQSTPQQALVGGGSSSDGGNAGTDGKRGMSTADLAAYLADPKRPGMSRAKAGMLLDAVKSAEHTDLERGQLDLQRRRFNAEANDKRYKEMMDMAVMPKLKHVDPETGKPEFIDDAEGNFQLQNSLQKALGDDWLGSLVTLPAQKRGQLIAQHRDLVNAMRASNKYASESKGSRGIEMDEAPQNLRQRSLNSNDFKFWKPGSMTLADAITSIPRAIFDENTVTDVQGPVFNKATGQYETGTIQSMPSVDFRDAAGGYKAPLLNAIAESEAKNRGR